MDFLSTDTMSFFNGKYHTCATSPEETKRSFRMMMMLCKIKTCVAFRDLLPGALFRERFVRMLAAVE